MVHFAKLAALLSALAMGQAAPAAKPVNAIEKRMSCSSLVGGLTLADCNYMASIGIVDQGVNSFSDNGYAWVGSDGPNTFTFVNSADNASITLVLWIGSRWLNVAQPYISYSLAVGQSVTISLANNFSGGFAGLYDGLTPLVSGLISNTWGEFSTGNWATIDVSREVNMGGNGMSINLDGCTSHMSKCVFQCSSGNVCGDSGTYELVDCARYSQPGANYGIDPTGNPAGGCTGFNNGGSITITLYD